MKIIPIVPAVIPSSVAEVKLWCQQLSFSHEFHLDVVDGVFVPAVSWPYSPAGEPLTVKQYLDSYTLEVDLMVSNPIQAAEQWVVAGADMLVFHVETLSQTAFASFAASTDVSVGVSAHGDTPLDTLQAYAEAADYIQIMGIYTIGAQGQSFDESVLDKIAQLKVWYPQKPITVDGSVNEQTIARLAKAGADRFIVGSAIVGQPDPAAAYASLQALINA